MNNKEHDALALHFIQLEQSFRGLPMMREVFDMARQVINAAPRAQDASGNWTITTPAGSDSTLHASALDRALRTVGVTTHSTRFSNSDVMQDIKNNAVRDEGSIEALLHKPTYDQVEFTIPNPSLPQAFTPK